MKRLRAGVLASLAAASAALLSVVHGSLFDDLLVAATTGAAGIAAYLATGPSKKMLPS
jgi:hypothetical protein